MTTTAKQTLSKVDQQRLWALLIKEPEHTKACLKFHEFTDPKIQVFLGLIAEEVCSVEEALLAMERDDRVALTDIGIGFCSEEGEKSLAEARTRLLVPAAEAWERIPKFSYSEKLQAQFLAAILGCSEMWVWADAMINPEYFSSPAHRALAKVILRYLREFGKMPGRDALESRLREQISKDLSWLIKQEKIDPKMAEDVRSEWREDLGMVLSMGIPEDLDFVIGEMTRWVETMYLAHNAIEVSNLAVKGDVEKAKQKLRDGASLIDNPLIGPQVVTDDRPLSAFTSRATNYLLQDRIPMGMVTLICGDAGLGKSTFLTEIACRVSRGELLPGAVDATIDLGSTIYVTTENDPERVFRPRVIACRGDLDKIRWMRNVLTTVPSSKKKNQTEVFDASRHLPALAKRIKELGDVRMVVIDPIISHISEKIDPNSSASVRQLLDTLSEFAAAHDIAVVPVGHMAKGVATSAVQKMAGSHQWVAAARVVLGIGREGEDEVPGVKSRIVKMLKANVYITDKALEFNMLDKWVDDVDETGESIKIRSVEVDWQGEKDIDSESMFNPERVEQTSRDKAIGILAQALKDGPLAEQEVQDRCAAAGVGRGSYYAARNALGIVSERMGFGRGASSRLWLPEHWKAYKDEGKEQ